MNDHNEQAGRKSSEELILDLNQWWEEGAERLNEVGRLFKARGITADVWCEDDGKGQQLRTEVGMTVAEKATAGLWLLQEAVLDYLAENPDATSRNIHEGVNLPSPNQEGGWEENLLWGVMNTLIRGGRVVSNKEVRPQRFNLSEAEARKRRRD